MDFNEYYWHDATIKNIQIDRTNPGENDTILFEIEWPEDRGQSLFRFNDVYWASFNLNFGIICLESVLHATVLDADNEDLRNFYAGWKGLMDEVKLDAYVIELNSTGGLIKIIAKGFTEESL